jgi:hypothetical protein
MLSVVSSAKVRTEMETKKFWLLLALTFILPPFSYEILHAKKVDFLDRPKEI